jgi:elongation factor 2
VALGGIEKALSKAGTLTSAHDGMPMRHMNFVVAPVVRHAVKPKQKSNLTKMVTGLQRVVNTDSSALFYKDKETQQYILAGTGELHIEVLVSAFIENTSVEIELSEPIIGFRETVQSESTEAALAKSDNKHNRVWIKASPLSEKLVDFMTSGELVLDDPKELGKAFVKSFGWNSTDATRIWAIGPEPPGHGDEITDRPSCLLTDSTFGLQIPEDAKANIVAAFMQVVREGVLVNSSMRGVRFDVMDAKFHADSVHRRPNSFVPGASRAMRGAFLMATPGLMEPVYNVIVTGSQ